MSTALGKRWRKKVANNTYLERRLNGDIEVVLHYTAVVVAHSDGTFTLNSGGWRSVTTKERINRFSPARVWQQNWTWYTGSFTNPDLFHDYIVVDANGLLVEPALEVAA